VVVLLHEEGRQVQVLVGREYPGELGGAGVDVLGAEGEGGREGGREGRGGGG
jgi:hypothetical protein